MKNRRNINENVEILETVLQPIVQEIIQPVPVPQVVQQPVPVQVVEQVPVPQVIAQPVPVPVYQPQPVPVNVATPIVNPCFNQFGCAGFGFAKQGQQKGQNTDNIPTPHQVNNSIQSVIAKLGQLLI